MPARLVALRATPERFVTELDRIWADGDAVLPIPANAPAATVQRTLRALRPARFRHLDDDGGFVDEPLGDAPDVAEGTALVVATSGSTGRPKGVVLPHEVLQASTRTSVERLGCRDGESWLLALPIHHVAGIQVVLRSRALGTEPVLSAPGGNASDPGGAAHVSLVPTQLMRLLEARAPLSDFRNVLLGGARPEASLLDAARDAGVHVVVSYGMTETAGGCVYDGRPLTGAEVEVVAAGGTGAEGGTVAADGDTGRIRIRGTLLGSGYRTRTGTVPLVDDDGWFLTGDLGRWRPDGTLEVFGRVDDVVVSGGVNVPAGAVAASLRSHPQVRDVAVTGRPDAEWGEAVVAVLVPRDPQRPPTLDELREHVRREYPATYAPRAVVVVEALPRDAMGKLPRTAVKLLAES
ncbi:AMP-binding protein [Egicoccus halophilus]|uniref:O-succinylbenzoic acid--CoA ligase n=1 Tax=Egicoccus halophilus TaxID=1670830 RepID=A0A8J3A7P0_9ACTN|nr:AMP-binding protein [Egicoccus halophilus]GGI05697.1 O-succinylbenzoic acid--CoA ligase [Egicoccus halophilus]